MINHATTLQTEQFMFELQNAQLKSHQLTSATIELTKKCNFKCIHCYIEDKENECDLDFEKVVSLIDELADIGCLSLLFTGGEPLLHPEFMKIWEYAYRKGMLLSLFTNASLIDDDLLEFFTRFPPMSIEIAIYGLKTETFEAVTGINDISETVIENIRKTVEKGLKIFLKSMALKQNAEDIVNMFKLSCELGVSFRFDPSINPTLNCNDRSYLYAGKSQLRKIINSITFTPEKEKEIFERACNLTGSLHHGDRLFCCGAGRASVFIDNHGNKHPCVSKRLNDNTVNLDISSCFEKVFPDALGVKTTDSDTLACIHCEDSYFCNWCPAYEKNNLLDCNARSKWRKNLCTSALLFKEKYFKKNYRKKNREKFIGYAGYFEKREKDSRAVNAENAEKS